MVFGGALAKKTLTDVQMLDALDNAGFDGVELPSTGFVGQPERIKEYRDYLKGSRLRVTCIDGMCNFVSRDPAVRAQGADALREAIDMAVSLDCPLVLAAGSRLSGDIAPSEGRQMTADGLNACMDEAKEAGVALGIEDFGIAPTLQCAARDCAAILDAAPGLVFVFDTGNFYFAGEDPLQNLAALGHRTRHVHFKDWVKSDTPQIADVSGALLGEGIIPNAELARRFKAQGVTSFSLECGGPGEILDVAKKDIETLRGWLA
ncbi:MAG: hypothetical protein QG656_2415 [Candidatus Hydrogenedentes bacterium]|nr:hypothetical protein [Candidatus Hydrogenedentota bacterium]